MTRDWFSQGWPMKRIRLEAHRREWAGYEDVSTYHPLRDGPRRQDWTWAVDALKADLAHESWAAAHEHYENQQAALGDVERGPSVRVQCASDPYAVMRAQWRQERAQALTEAANGAVRAHDDATAARLAVFTVLFLPHQPTLEQVRAQGRPGGVRLGSDGRVLRMNQRETVDRIKWCCEVLAGHFAQQRAPFEASR